MESLVWIGSIGIIIGLFVLDFFLLSLRRARTIPAKESLSWAIIWGVPALCFNVFIYFLYENNWFGWTDLPSHTANGQQAVIQFFTGFLLEKSLSVDNIFAVTTIFLYLKAPLVEQDRILQWNTLSVLGLRAGMIALGAVLIYRFHWMNYLFGGVLIMIAIKMLIIHQDKVIIGHNPLISLAMRFYPIADNFKGENFFSPIWGNQTITPFVLAWGLVASSHLIFTFSSILAAFVVSQDPFLVFTSNALSLLGFRALYFTLKDYIGRLRYIKLGLVFIFAYLSIKIIFIHFYPIPNITSLAIIGTTLMFSILASIAVLPTDSHNKKPLFNDVAILAVLSYRQARKVVVLISGTLVLLVGIAMIVLPGPAVVVIPIGLGILAIEFAWARRWLQKIRQTAGKIKQRIQS